MQRITCMHGVTAGGSETGECRMGLDWTEGEGRGGASPAVPEELAWGHCPHPHAPSAATAC